MEQLTTFQKAIFGASEGFKMTTCHWVYFAIIFLSILYSCDGQCKYFSFDTAANTDMYIAPDVCFGNRTNMIYSAGIYKCNNNGDIEYYTYNNKTECDANQNGKLQQIYNATNSKIQINCNGNDCSSVWRNYVGCDIDKDDYKEQCFVNDMCGIVGKGTVGSEKFVCSSEIGVHILSFNDDKCLRQEGSELIKNGCSQGLNEYNEVLVCNGN